MNVEPRAILVCVDFADLLALTLPYNRHHFSEVMVVTTPTDELTIAVAKENDAQVFVTDSFYARGASFNKWLALEEAFGCYGRKGWICNMDADVLWPRDVPNYLPLDYPGYEVATAAGWPVFGHLYTPFRRMLTKIPTKIPDEVIWNSYPLHPQQAEFAGYTQIFHASDPLLGKPPWHQTDWRHAGGADSFFQAKWPKERKIRPPFEVLHLGESGINWAGRTVPYADGTVHKQAEARAGVLRGMLSKRRRGDQYKHERL